MARHLKIAAAQLGPLHRADTRAAATKRLVALLREADSAEELEELAPAAKPPQLLERLDLLAQDDPAAGAAAAASLVLYRESTGRDRGRSRGTFRPVGQ